MDDTEIGYLESGQWLEKPSRTFNQKKLLSAAEAAYMHNTGWPIGVVLHRTGLAPVPTAEGIEARIGDFKQGRYDYWALTKEGRFYFLRKFEEDTEQLTGISPPPPKRAIWWDVRLWRITEIFCYSAALYKALGVHPDAPFGLVINHKGLAGRALYTSNPARYSTSGEKICSSSESSWEKTLTQELIVGGLKELVFEVMYQLLVLFDFAEISRETVSQVVDDFLKSRT